MKLKLDQKVTLQGKLYSVIGIDAYVLTNITRKTRRWISYTLQTKGKQKAWISYGTSGRYFIQWITISETQFKEDHTKELNEDLTGIANITFAGNPGYSTPVADILWFNSKNSDYEYLGVERFLTIDETSIRPDKAYFMIGKVLKDFKI